MPPKAEKKQPLTREDFQATIDGLKVPRRNGTIDDVLALTLVLAKGFMESLPSAEETTKAKATKGGLSKSHSTWVGAAATNATAACKNEEWVKYITSFKATPEDLKPNLKDGKPSSTALSNYNQYLGMIQNSEIDRTSPEFYRILGVVLLKSKSHHEAVDAKAKVIHAKLLADNNTPKKDVAEASDDEDETETEKKKPAKKPAKAIKPVTKKADSDEEDAKEDSAEEEQSEEEEKPAKKATKKPAKKSSKKDSGEESS